MKTVLVVLSSLLATVACSQKPDSTIYELRIYKTADGKKDLLKTMIRDRAEQMFVKHRMTMIGFWIDADSNRVIYIVAHKSKQAMRISWNDFYADPAWPSLKADLSSGGPATLSIKSIPMQGADILPKQIKEDPATTRYELRIYTCFPDRLVNLIDRFKKKTNSLFAKHHMIGLAYWESVESDDTQPLLIYVLAHKDKESQEANWKEFRVDPEWITFRDETESSGKIVDRVEVINMGRVR